MDFEAGDPCLCEYDADGQCLKCRDNAIKACQAITLIMRDFLGKMESLKEGLSKSIEGKRESLEPVCRQCAEKYVDLAISGIVPMLKGTSEFIARGCLTGMVQTMGERGVAETPLTKKAWMDLCAREGWKP